MNFYQELHAALLAHEPKSLGFGGCYYNDSLPCCAAGVLYVYSNHTIRARSSFEERASVFQANDAYQGTAEGRYSHMLTWSEERGKL